MTQVVYRLTSRDRIEALRLPSASAFVLDEVPWGSYARPFTPAFWRASLWVDGKPNSNYSRGPCRDRILRETTFCLLGGYGIRAEVSRAYFEKLSDAGVFRLRPFSERRLRTLLQAPARHDGKTYRYRFPNQKARYLANALRMFSNQEIPNDDIGLRDWLLQLPGVGYKTAAWIVRNCLGSDNVAIIDIHLQRAGRYMGLFDARELSATTYAYFEDRFLAFARALQVRASALDLFIWQVMREFAPKRLLG